MKDNAFRGIIVSILFLLLAGIGYCIFHCYKFNNELYKLHTEVQSNKVVDHLNNTDKEKCSVVEKIITKSNPWTELQGQLKDTVVQVFNQRAVFNWLEPYKTPDQGVSSGSGFFISDQGHIITNAHVVHESKALKIQIPSMGKEQLAVKVIGVTPDRDLALLKLEDKDLEKIRKELGSVPFLQLGDSDKVKRASEIMLLGYPLGQQSLKSTAGVVSGRESVSGRQYIQVDSPANPGNSGGPALNPDGKVIGIMNSQIQGAQNVNYVIPVNELKLILNDLYNSRENKLVRKPFLGIFYNVGSPSLTEYLGNPQPGGVYVTNTFPGSVLKEVGVQPGDMIYELNGHRVDLYGDISATWSEDKISMVDYISFIPLGSTVTLVLYRKGEKKIFNFEFKEAKLPAIRLMFSDHENIDYEVIGGMVVMELCRNLIPVLMQNSPELIRYEKPKNQIEPVLVITHILPDSAAQGSRVLMPGTRISEINGIKVNSLKDFRDAIPKSIDNDYFTVKTFDDIFAVFPFRDMLRNEYRLAGIYRFPVSKVVEAISKEVFSVKEDAA